MNHSTPPSPFRHHHSSSQPPLRPAHAKYPSLSILGDSHSQTQQGRVTQREVSTGKENDRIVSGSMMMANGREVEMTGGKDRGGYGESLGWGLPGQSRPSPPYRPHVEVEKGITDGRENPVQRSDGLVSSTVNRDFERLLDDLQLPQSLRIKLEPLDTPVKASMLMSARSGVNGRDILGLTGGGGGGKKELRKVRSGSELNSPSSRGFAPSPGTGSGSGTGNSIRNEGISTKSYEIQKAGKSRFVMITPSNLPPLPSDPSNASSPGPNKASQQSSNPYLINGLPSPIKRGRGGSSIDGGREIKSGKMSLFTGRKKGKGKLGSVVGGSTMGNESEFLPIFEDGKEGKGGKKKKSTQSHLIVDQKDPKEFVEWIKKGKLDVVDVGKMKTLRMLLRHESTTWVKTFVDVGGYAALLGRLHEVLPLEWRDEQHDDQLLHELLRCIKALSTAECGKQALRQHGAVPFRALADLLYSEKKPGEVSTRQLIVELIHLLLELYPASMITSPSMPTPAMFAPPRRPWDTDSASGSASSRDARPLSITFDLPNGPPIQPLIPNGHANITGFIRALLQPSPDSDDKANEVKGNILPPAFELPPNKVDVHDFLAVASLPRVYKTYLMELSQLCHDYFWIMCHGQNGIWEMSELDVRSVAKPSAPCGASGGVEFEAMDYMTTHFRLVNALSTALFEQDMLDPVIRNDPKKGAAWQFHADMMMSGMDRILITVRKASTEFYPHFHLELARYVRHCQDAQLELPYPVKQILAPPPDQYRKQDPSQLMALHQAEGAGRGKQWIPQTVSFGKFDFQTTHVV